MSKYKPASIAAAELDIAGAPYFGGEWAVYLSHEAALKVGELLLSAPATGVYTPNAAVTLPAEPVGADLVVVAETPLLSAAKTVITLAGQDNTDPTPVAMDGVATFSPPVRAVNQSFNFQRHYAVDLVEATPGQKFTSITGLDTVVGGSANVQFGVYALPEISTYSLVGCTMDINFNPKSRRSVGIDCNMETDAFIKRGKTQPGNLTLGAKFKSFGEGLARFDGHRTTCMLIGLKEGQVTGDRLVFTQWVPALGYSFPDGEGEATNTNEEGKYAECFMFVAGPDTP